jgi:hypothetical protein
MKAKWSHLPPDVQTYVAQRDKETHAAITRAGQYLKALDQQIKGYEPLDQLIEAHQDMFARRGITPAQGFAVLLDAQRTLEADPVAGLVNIGLGYGVDLRPFFQARSGHSSQGGQQPSANQVAPDPRTAQLLTELREELRQTKHTLAAHDSKANAMERAQQQALVSALKGAIAEFSHDKPYFEEVKPLMAALVESLQARDLADAYDMAVNAHPDIRRRIHADQRKAEEEKRAAEARSKADQARRAAAVNVRSTPITATPKTMDDTLNEIARRRYA